jgi:hypothetical protein
VKAVGAAALALALLGGTARADACAASLARVDTFGAHRVDRPVESGPCAGESECRFTDAEGVVYDTLDGYIMTKEAGAAGRLPWGLKPGMSMAEATARLTALGLKPAPGRRGDRNTIEAPLDGCGPTWVYVEFRNGKAARAGIASQP